MNEFKDAIIANAWIPGSDRDDWVIYSRSKIYELCIAQGVLPSDVDDWVARHEMFSGAGNAILMED